MALPDLPKIVMSNICGPFSKKSVFEKLEIEISAVDPHSFYADPDPTVFLTADPDPDPDPGPGPDEPNLKKKNHKEFSKVVKNKFTLKKLNKVAVINNLLAFFQFLGEKFTLLNPDPDLHIECGSGSGSRSRSENECGSMRIRIHSPD